MKFLEAIDWRKLISERLHGVLCAEMDMVRSEIVERPQSFAKSFKAPRKSEVSRTKHRQKFKLLQKLLDFNNT
jgi:hypothetical protein